MNDSSHIYIGTAFVAGILLTVGLKDLVYPELEQRLREYRSKRGTRQDFPESSSEALVARHGPPAIVEGIEGCIGNTPLLRIKSLSEATGCEILAKAEVRTSMLYYSGCSLTFAVSKWCRSKLQRPSGAQYDRNSMFTISTQ